MDSFNLQFALSLYEAYVLHRDRYQHNLIMGIEKGNVLSDEYDYSSSPHSLMLSAVNLFHSVVREDKRDLVITYYYQRMMVGGGMTEDQFWTKYYAEV